MPDSEIRKIEREIVQKSMESRNSCELNMESAISLILDYKNKIKKLEEVLAERQDMPDDYIMIPASAWDEQVQFEMKYEQLKATHDCMIKWLSGKSGRLND